MKSEDGTGGRHPLLGDVDCHPPISFDIEGQVTLVICLLRSNNTFNKSSELMQSKKYRCWLELFDKKDSPANKRKFKKFCSENRIKL